MLPILNLIFFHILKMFEATNYKTTDSLMKLRINFRYDIYFEEVHVPKDFANDICYGFGLHPEENESCEIERKHSHLVLESRPKLQKRGKGYALPNLYLNGGSFEKFCRALIFDCNLVNKSLLFPNTKRIYKQGLIVRKRIERSMQTSNLSPVFPSRPNLILDGQQAPFFM